MMSCLAVGGQFGQGYQSSLITRYLQHMKTLENLSSLSTSLVYLESI